LIAGFQKTACRAVRIPKLRRKSEPSAPQQQLLSQPRKVLVVECRVLLSLHILQNAEIGLDARVNGLQGLLSVLGLQPSRSIKRIRGDELKIDIVRIRLQRSQSSILPLPVPERSSPCADIIHRTLSEPWQNACVIVVTLCTRECLVRLVVLQSREILLA